jgi:2Fe-2S ferredoxin
VVTVTFLPTGRAVEVEPGTPLLVAAEKAGVEVEHNCGGVATCGNCHVVVREGWEALPPATEDEEDGLDAAVGLTPRSRLACQLKVTADLTVEIPRHTRHIVPEGRP